MALQEKINNILENHKLDGLLITHPINRRYLTNFTGTAGVVLITHTDNFLITDSRYTEQAKAQAENYIVIEHTQLIEKEVAKLINNKGLNNIGFESEGVTYKLFQQY